MRRILKPALAGLLLAGCATYLVMFPESVALLMRLSWMSAAGLVLLQVLFMVANGVTFWLVVRIMEVRLSPFEVVGLTALTNVANYLAPGRPGAAAKAVYLRQRKGLSFAHFSAVIAAIALVMLFLSGLLGLILLIVLQLSEGGPPAVLWPICAVLVAAAIAAFVIDIPSVSPRGRIRGFVSRAQLGFREIRDHRHELGLVAASVLAQHVIAAVMVLFTYRALGNPLGLLDAASIGVFTAIANLFAITPNNLGVQELVMAWLAQQFQLGFGVGLVGAGVIRAAQIVALLLLVPTIIPFMAVTKSKQGFNSTGEMNPPDIE